MKILVLGGDGMLGHQLTYSLAGSHDVECTLRRPIEDYIGLAIFDNSRCYYETDIRDTQTIAGILDDSRPEVVINSVGIVKQRPESQESMPSIEINALAPHQIAEVCRQRDIRFVHVSTDCVFDGKKGEYTESDPCNVSDIYGLTKYLGEVHTLNAITLRTSIIGHELSRKTGLLEWFLAQDAEIAGYRNAIFSGLTTVELANVMDMLLTRFPDASGLYHVASSPINKYELLGLFNSAYSKDIAIQPEDSFKCDRSLKADRFNSDFGYAPPDWQQLVTTMKSDYEGRSSDA